MNTENNTQTAILQALADHAGYDLEDIEPARFDYYGLDSFTMGREEWAIGSDDDAQEAVKESIKQSLWAFNASYLLRLCDLPYELEEAFQAWQEKECEGCNDALEKLIEKTCCMDRFVTDAVCTESGRGHFLSSYDGEEVELDVEGVGTFYAYRIN